MLKGGEGVAQEMRKLDDLTSVTLEMKLSLQSKP